MITATLIIITVGLAIMLALATVRIQHLTNRIEVLDDIISKLEKTNEVSNATRQLLRNELTLLQSKLAQMEKPSVPDKPKKKRSAPKMNANNKKEQK